MKEEIGDRLTSANKCYYSLYCIYLNRSVYHINKKKSYKQATYGQFQRMAVKIWQLLWKPHSLIDFE